MLFVAARNPQKAGKSTNYENIFAGGGIAPVMAGVGAQAAPNKGRAKRPLTMRAAAGSIAPTIATR